MLKIESLNYSIRDRLILHNLQLNLERGQYFALAGENGAGKSTLIKITLDLIRRNANGHIRIDGHSHRSLQARKKVAYLPENFHIKRNVTGWQYLDMIFGVYQQSPERGNVLRLCERMSLDSARLDDDTRKYSKGMRQKLGLISSFMLEVPLIILDEPLTGLDPRARYRFKELLQEERGNKRTVFYSTHMLADAEEICDRFAILHQGRILFEGSPAGCMQRYGGDTLEQAYMSCISEPGSNQLSL